MIKSLVSLTILVLAPVLTLFLYEGPYNPASTVLTRLAENYYEDLFGGTFMLIEQNLESVDPTDRVARFTEISEQFGSRLELKNIDKTDLSVAEKKRVRAGHTVYSLSSEVGKLSRLFAESNLVITMFVDETEVQMTYRQSKGPLFLIEQFIQSHPQEDWPAVVEHLDQRYPIPLELISQTSFSPPEDFTESFLIDNISWFESEEANDREILFLKLKGTDQGLLVGPIPSTKSVEVSLYVFVLTFLVFLMTLCILFWLWPLWRNLNAMKASAIAFGEGHLTTRVEVRKTSIVSDLANSFNSMANSIQNLITANQHLTNAVAHDLRTPLARLRFALEILEVGDCSPEETVRYKQSIDASIDSIDYLVNQTLTHARYNRVADVKNFGEHDFAHLLREEFVQTELDHPQLNFELVIDRSLESELQFLDKNALRRALTNLLSNAVKHARSRIRVSYKKEHRPTQSQKSECLFLSVEDDGTGIDEENYQRIMQPFAQLNNDARNASMGHGLGLAIVNQVAKWHKGRVKVSRSSLGGACIELSWPILPSKKLKNTHAKTLSKDDLLIGQPLSQ